jgi:hypothetical protein
MTTTAPRTRQRPLSGPYAASVAAGPHGISPAVNSLVAAQVNALLSSSAAWHEMSPRARAEMQENLQKISAYTAALVQEDFAISDHLGQTPMLRQQQIVPADAPFAQAAAGPKKEKEPPPPPPPPEQFSSRGADQVGRVTRETLNAIAFPTFVADLIKGTFNAIVDASIKQMEAFATLLANVAKTVDQFMSDNITDNQARDWLAGQYPEQFQVEVGKGDDADTKTSKSRSSKRGGGRDGGAKKPGARLRVRGGKGGDKPNFRRDLGLNQDVELDDKSTEETLVPAARRKLAQQRHQLLSTMVLMGINRIVITSGRIYAKMGFEIDTSDTGTAEQASQFDFSHDSVAGGSFLGFGASAHTSVAYVSSTKKNSSDSIDVHADLTGEVDLKFKSETFPLERFADMGAIGQIQSNTANPSANSPQTSVPVTPPAGAPPAPASAP